MGIMITHQPSSRTAKKVIGWWWEFIETHTPEQQSKILQFITASSVVPVQGFRGLQGNYGQGY